MTQQKQHLHAVWACVCGRPLPSRTCFMCSSQALCSRRMLCSRSRLSNCSSMVKPEASSCCSPAMLTPLLLLPASFEPSASPGSKSATCEKKRKENLMLSSDHDGSLLKQQPGAVSATCRAMNELWHCLSSFIYVVIYLCILLFFGIFYPFDIQYCSSASGSFVC